LFLFVKTISKLNLESRVKFQIENSINWPLWFTFSGQRRILSFHVVVLQGTVRKGNQNYNVRAQPLYCSLILLFSDVAVVVFLNSLEGGSKSQLIFRSSLLTIRVNVTKLVSVFISFPFYTTARVHITNLITSAKRVIPWPFGWF